MELADWYPEQIVQKHQGAEVIVTFNLAPPTLGLRKYFSWCYGPKGKTYMGITPVSPARFNPTRRHTLVVCSKRKINVASSRNIQKYINK